LATAAHLKVKFKSSFVPLLIPNGVFMSTTGNPTGKIVSVTYSKMGDNETFSKDEIQALTGLNQGSGLVTKVSGGEFEVSTPKQLQLEQDQ
jgi:hypothetical protein